MDRQIDTMIEATDAKPVELNEDQLETTGGRPCSWTCAWTCGWTSLSQE
ncbi:hypothetical protein KSF73_06660 [Burkholderiaceae bacterium DAT-1]|nr:hypothetical protein [Burkholderiaceae bacterium DAT-1]